MFHYGEWRPDIYADPVNITIVKEVTINGDVVDLWDCPGQEQFEIFHRLKSIMYRETDIILICFALDNMHSYENISSKWIPEIKHLAPDALKILVGLKSDIKIDRLWVNNHLLVYGYIHQFKYKDIHIFDDIINVILTYFPTINKAMFGDDEMEYMEVSSLRNVNVQEVFDRALVKFLAPEPIVKSSSNCNCTML